MATKVSAVWGGTSSDQRCCRWVLGGTTVLEDVVSLSSEEACEVLMVSDGGICRWGGMSKLALGNELGKDTPMWVYAWYCQDEYLRGVASRWFVGVDQVHSWKHAVKEG